MNYDKLVFKRVRDMKPGMMVMIRPDLHLHMDVKFGVNEEMEAMAGEIVTIRRISGDFVYFDKHTKWNWSSGMFMPIIDVVKKTPDELFAMYVDKQINKETYEKLLASSQKEG